MSLGSTGEQASGYFPSITTDGRYVAFSSASANVVPGDTNGRYDIFVRDRHGDTTERVSIDSSGAEGNHNSEYASISADGRHVAFQSMASNLVSGDTNGFIDVFVHDRQTGVTERVSVDSAGNQSNWFCAAPRISADGRYVVFNSFASNLVAGDTNGVADVFLHDRQSGVTERVSLATGGTQAGGSSSAGGQYSAGSPISADGRYVVFWSDATNLVSGDTNGFSDVFLRDRQNGTTERLSVAAGGAQGNQYSRNPSLSPDGRFVTFDSLANNLVAGDTNATTDVFVCDRQSGTNERVSLATGGAQGDDLSQWPSISADGRYVAFASSATNLVGGDTNGRLDIFVHDRQAGSTWRVNVDSAGAQTDEDGTTDVAWISDDGRFVAFHTTGVLVSDDTNGTYDVFVHGLCGASSSATFSGDGVNPDVIFPTNITLGSYWHAFVNLGHLHGAGGPLVLKVRSSTINGPNLSSPIGGRTTEVLISGPFLATISGSHDGNTGDIPPQFVPDDVSLQGVPWAAQYTVLGGGFADLSQAVFGVIGCQ